VTQNYQSYLFNFSCSHFGGALKRIHAYLKWFNEHGGACFVLNYRLKGIEKTFPANRYCFLRQHALAKVLNYSYTLNQFIKKMGTIDFYYSYGIPLPYKPGRVNWMHIANVLTLVNPRQHVPFKRSLELQLLGLLIKRSLKHADIISAESEATLSCLKHPHTANLVVCVNGSDEEIMAHQSQLDLEKSFQTDNIAVTVGTCQYKCVDDAYKIYLHLRESNPQLVLVIAGIKEDVPAHVQRDPQVELRDVIPQLAVCDLLKRAKYYITSTVIENSYNAASEGAFLAKESFLSDIGPHRELLKGVGYQVINHLGTRVASLYVTRKDLNANNLKSWHQVISEMIEKATSPHHNSCSRREFELT